MSLSLAAIRLSIDGRHLLGPIDLEIAGAEIVTLMGPSGCGKSSLLACIAGTLALPLRATGRVVLNGSDITEAPPETRRVGILFQDDLLFPHLTIGENLAFGLAERDRAARHERVEAALAEAGLEGFGARDPATLSGGQRARAAVIRALLAEPRALLLDEPFSRLDVPLRARFRQFVFDHARRKGLPTLLVAHDPADGEAAGGRVIALAPPATP